MKQTLARRVVDELSGLGSDPRFHELEDKHEAFSVGVRTLVRVGEDFGAGLHLDDRGRITVTWQRRLG